MAKEKIENLVIVESPAKAKTLEKFLGKDYKVMSSYGHIRDLKKNSLSVKDGYEPEYEIPEDKDSIVKNLRKEAHRAETVWLASDEDREGEAISWHLASVLDLDISTTKRIVFHEITKNAILEAIKHPRTIDLNLVNAQQARRVLDRIVGFKLSPILWKKLKPQLSAGRVQSVSVRLIVEREREIDDFKAESNFKVVAVLKTNSGSEFSACLDKRFNTKKEAEDFLTSLCDASFSAKEITKHPINRAPAPPFTTSTLQQEAARKLGFTVSQTMMISQHLYESGLITYMRTDSVNLSELCINSSKKFISNAFGKEYSKPRKFQTHAKGAQEAHEAIRPTFIENQKITGTNQEKKLYELIWKRTVASQMSDAVVEKTVIQIEDSRQNKYVAEGETIKFDGFMKVYNISNDEDDDNTENNTFLPSVKKGEKLSRCQVIATEHFSVAPYRYTEASLVRKLEELGIGRPSTYAPIISTIQQREYVRRGTNAGTKREFCILTLDEKGKIKTTKKTEMAMGDKGKLVPTDIGIVVNDFLMRFFPNIMDYNFTANAEKDFDDVATGKAEWKKIIKEFDRKFEPLLKKSMTDKSEHKIGERVLGTDPKTGRLVSVKIGRFGPVVQIGTSEDTEKPRFAQLKKEQSIKSITLNEALELFCLPRTVGTYEDQPVNIGEGRFGPYILHKGKFTTLTKEYDPLSVTLEECINLIEQNRKVEANRHLKTFNEDAEMEIIQGRWGPYIAYKGKNYKIPKKIKEPLSLTYEECLELVK